MGIPIFRLIQRTTLSTISNYYEMNRRFHTGKEGMLRRNLKPDLEEILFFGN